MSKERIKEILCVLLLVLFIAVISSESKISTKSSSEVFESIKESIDISAISKRSDKNFEEEFSLSSEDYEGVIYYGSSSVMEVREIIIIKLKDKNQKDEVLSSFEKRVEEKIKLFEGYAPDEAELLKRYVLTEKDGFVFFAVCDDTAKAVSAFKSAVS